MGEALRSWDEVEVDEFEYSSAEAFGEGGVMGKVRGVLRMVDNREGAATLEKAQKERAYDLWIIHNVFPAMSASVYDRARSLKVKVIHYLHNYRFGCLNGVLFREGRVCEECLVKGLGTGVRYGCWQGSRFKSLCAAVAISRMRHSGAMNAFDAYVAVSRREADLLTKIGFAEEKLHVIPHFLNASKQSDDFLNEEAKGERRRGRDVLFIGRLSPEKGVYPLLEAWAALGDTGRTLLIAGKGPEEERLKDFVQERGLANVSFLGFVDKDSIQAASELWQRTAFVVVPSACEETFGLTVLEAWEYGRPALVTPMGGLPELINDGENGWIALGNGVDALRWALEKACACDDSEIQRMGAKGRVRLLREYSEDSWRTKLKRLVDAVMAR